MSGENDARILFAQGLEPFAQLRGEGRTVEHQPAFIDDDERRRAVEAAFDTVKQIGQHGRRSRRSGQPFGLERLETRFAQPFALGIEEPSERPADAVGGKRLLQCLRLQKDSKPGERALSDRRARQRAQRRPQMILGFWIDCDALRNEDRLKPFRGPVALCRLIDPRQRLQQDWLVAVLGKTRSQILPIAAARERGRTDRATEIESENLRLGIAAKLQRHHCQQDRFARPGRTDDEAVSDVTDMKRKPERGRAFGLGVKQRRRVEMRIVFRSGPDSRKRHHMRKVQRRDRGLANIAVDMAGQRSEPGLDRIHAFGHAGKIAALDDLFDQPQLLGGKRRFLVPHRNGRGDQREPDMVGAQLLQRGIGILGLVGGIAVDQHRSLVGHHFLEDRGDRFALGEPLAANFRKQLRRIGFVEHDCPRRPAIGKA